MDPLLCASFLLLESALNDSNSKAASRALEKKLNHQMSISITG
jgi:hypothetical protein